jgi:hypothetical protein
VNRANRRLSTDAWPQRPWSRRVWLRLAVAVLAVGAVGAACKRNPRVVPVSGTVLYNGKPLPFGSIQFQPDKGQAAMGEIQGDGSFKLSSYVLYDGAVPARHLVSVSCYEGQRPGSAGTSAGRLLIPLKYTRLGSSGLSAEVKDATGQTFEFKLEGPPLK